MCNALVRGDGVSPGSVPVMLCEHALWVVHDRQTLLLVPSSNVSVATDSSIFIGSDTYYALLMVMFPLTLRALTIKRRSSDSAGASDGSSADRTRPVTDEQSSKVAVP
jgi:hypothetical protein